MDGRIYLRMLFSSDAAAGKKSTRTCQHLWMDASIYERCPIVFTESHAQQDANNQEEMPFINGFSRLFTEAGMRLKTHVMLSGATNGFMRLILGLTCG